MKSPPNTNPHTLDFFEKYKSYSNTKLLRIIDNADDYQPAAVETAKKVLADRQLSDEEIASARNELAVEQQEKLKQEQKKQVVDEKFKTVIENLNPLTTESLTTDKIIKAITVLYGGILLYQLYKEFDMLRFLFTDSTAVWDFSVVLYYLPLVLLLIGTLLFYKKNKRGWLLLTVYVSYAATSALGLLLYALTAEPLGIPGIDLMFPMPSVAVQFFSLLVYTASLWTLSKAAIREVYGISKQTLLLTIGITALIVGFGLKGLF